jgi:phage terminase Nu1 subunit (DNA packaging protein)
MVKKHEKLTKGRKPSATSLHAARTRKERALAELREIEVAQKRGQLIDADEVAREWSDILRQVRAGVLAITSRVRSRLPHLTAHDAAYRPRDPTRSPPSEPTMPTLRDVRRPASM